MPDSSVNLATPTGNADTVTAPSGDHRQVVIVGDRGGYTGRAATFRIPGRAGTTGQKLFAIHNAAGSTVNVDLEAVTIDLAVTVVKAVTVLPPLIRLSRFTAAVTGGAALPKVPINSALTSSGSVTLTQDASAEGTSSTTALTITATGGLTQEFAPRFITAAGYEPADRLEFLTSGAVTLRPGEGAVMELVYTLATQNPTTDMWAGSLRWSEYVP